jgi:hypothetical protein
VPARLGFPITSSAQGRAPRVIHSKLRDAVQREPGAFQHNRGGGLANGVLGDTSNLPLRPGTRSQFNVGMQQAIGKHIVLDSTTSISERTTRMTSTSFEYIGRVSDLVAEVEARTAAHED